MPFKPGKSGNPGGRPKGAEGLIRQQIRNNLTAKAPELVDNILEDLKKIESPKDKVSLSLKLLEFALPRLSATHLDVKTEHTGETLEYKLGEGVILKF